MRTVKVRWVGPAPVPENPRGAYRIPRRPQLMSHRLYDVLRVGLAAGEHGITGDELHEATGINAVSVVIAELRARHGYRIVSRDEARIGTHKVFRYWFYPRGEQNV